jgi:dTDP-4-amino-4,6-dideoxygalactose transaminase
LLVTPDAYSTQTPAEPHTAVPASDRADAGRPAPDAPPQPFNRPWVSGRETEYVADALARRHFSGDGGYTRRCHAILEALHGAPKALLTTSCTHALEMAAMLLDVGPGDEVIVPSFTFVSTANAVVLRGATPVFVDVRPDTLNLDERLLASHITERTRAIVVVHYGGIGAEMDAILGVAAPHGIPVVEDNAHGLFGAYRGRALGTFGALSTLSFHETKNVVCGEGGALVINDPGLIERAEIIREKGTDRSRFFRGQVDKYTWVDIGSSYLPSEILAAVLLAQLEARERVQPLRRRVFERYQVELADWARDEGVTLPTVPADRDPAFHLFYLLLPSLAARTAFIEHLRARSISAVFHYLPLHLSPMGRRFGPATGGCPVTESVSDRLVRLPFYNDLGARQQDRVVEAVRDFHWRS